MVGKRTKYTPENVQRLLDVMAQTGSDVLSAQAGTISRDTLYEWIKKYPEFADQVSRARAEYRETCPEVLVRQANAAFADYLYGRMEKVIVTKETGTNLRTGEPYERETVQRVPVGIPRWSIERVLGKPLDILEAIKTLSEAGILPRWVVQRAIDEVGSAREGIAEAFRGILPDNDARPAKPGLSEETAAAIRAHVLGIEPSSAAALSSSLDTRPQQD